MKSIKNKIVIENATKCKLVRTKYESDGHDCWGNTESTTRKYVLVGDEIKYIYGDDLYIMHNEVEVLDVDYIDKLPENIQKYLDIDLYNKLESEKKEKRYKHYLKLKKEFDSDVIYNRDQKILKIIDND